MKKLVSTFAIAAAASMIASASFASCNGGGYGFGNNKKCDEVSVEPTPEEGSFEAPPIQFSSEEVRLRFEGIDTNGDQVLSDAEIAAYAAQVEATRAAYIGE